MGNSVITIKRGDTLPLGGVITLRDETGVDVSSDVDFSEWKIACQVRNGPKSSAVLLADATVAFVGTTNAFDGEVSAADTASFPDKCWMDIRFADELGKVMSTQTIVLNVEDSVSEPPL